MLPEDLLIGPKREPNELGYVILKSKEKTILRSPRRTQYFYNILLLIALSLVLYLFSSQFLSSGGGGGGGGGGGDSTISSSSNSGNSDNNVIVASAASNSYISNQRVSSLSVDINTQKTGQLSSSETAAREENEDDDNAMLDSREVGDGEVQQVVFDRGTSSSSSTVRTTTTFEETPTTKNWLNTFSETARKVYAMFTPDYLKEFRKWAVNKQREAIAQEMEGYKYQNGKNVKLNDLVMEKGGQPIRNVIFTTWRSGSTFLGETLDSHPGTFYHYEPLLHSEIKQVRSGKLAQEGLRVLNQLLNCNYTGLNDFMKYGKTHHWLYSHNSRVWQYCEKSYDVCWDPKFLSDMCRLFPFQSVKTVRMRLRLAKSLLENKKFNIRLLLLIRDPRGTMQSRNHRDWCPEDADCFDPSRLCADMVDDFNYAEKLREQYPDRFLLVTSFELYMYPNLYRSIRYEDMSLSPYESMQKIFKFFRLQYHPRVEKFLSSHTVANAGGVSSTFRDSKTTPFHWRNDFVGNFSLVTDIQGSCDAAMKLWGYESVNEEDQLLTFNPLRKPPWPEMLVLNSSKAHEEIYVK